MLRNINLTVSEIMTPFCDSIDKVLEVWQHKMKEDDGLKESERTKAHHTVKILESFFDKRGGLSI